MHLKIQMDILTQDYWKWIINHIAVKMNPLIPKIRAAQWWREKRNEFMKKNVLNPQKRCKNERTDGDGMEEGNECRWTRKRNALTLHAQSSENADNASLLTDPGSPSRLYLILPQHAFLLWDDKTPKHIDHQWIKGNEKNDAEQPKVSSASHRWNSTCGASFRLLCLNTRRQRRWGKSARKQRNKLLEARRRRYLFSGG